MSHRHKDRPRIEVKEQIMDPIQMSDVIGEILEKDEAYFTCPMCKYHEHTDLGGEDNALAFVCDHCGETIPILVPIYYGRGHTMVMGYQVFEYGPQGVKLHMIGHFPEGFAQSIADDI